MTRRGFTSKCKTKVILDLLKERLSLSEWAEKDELAPQQLFSWKRAFLNGAEQVFEGKRKSKKAKSEEEQDKLLKIIGKQKAMIIFLDNALH